MPRRKNSSRREAGIRNITNYNLEKNGKDNASAGPPHVVPTREREESISCYETPRYIYPSLSQIYQDDDDGTEDFVLKLSDDEEDEEENEDFQEIVPIHKEKSDIGVLSGASLRNSLLNRYINEKEALLSASSDGEIISLPLKVLKDVFSTTFCKQCGSHITLEVDKYGFDIDLKLKCRCAEPSVFQHTKVQECESAKTEQVGETTASFVYQNMINGGGLAALNNTRSTLGAKPLANSTNQRYKKYIEQITEKSFKESMKEVDKSIFYYYESIGVRPDEQGNKE